MQVFKLQYELSNASFIKCTFHDKDATILDYMDKLNDSRQDLNKQERSGEKEDLLHPQNIKQI